MIEQARIAKPPTRAPSGPTCAETTVSALTALGPAASPAGQDRPLWLLDLVMPDWARWRPGQFVMLRPASWGFEPLWARPFSICMAEAGILRIFFQDAGRGTSALTRLRPGDKAVLWGPLGTSLATRPETRTLLLAGGMGLAPFIGYVRAHPRLENVRLILGHRLDRACYPLDLLPEGLSREILRQETEAEVQAFVDHLAERIREHALLDGLVLACGPHPFLHAVRTLALEHGVKAQLSMENRMACGVGACLGCVVETPKGPPAQVCTQGPVFWATDIQFQE